MLARGDDIEVKIDVWLTGEHTHKYLYIFLIHIIYRVVYVVRCFWFFLNKYAHCARFQYNLMSYFPWHRVRCEAFSTIPTQSHTIIKRNSISCLYFALPIKIRLYIKNHCAFSHLRIKKKQQNTYTIRLHTHTHTLDICSHFVFVVLLLILVWIYLFRCTFQSYFVFWIF